MPLPLPTDVAANNTGHATLHNQERAEINALGTRMTAVEANGSGGGGSGAPTRLWMPAAVLVVNNGTPVRQTGTDGNDPGLDFWDVDKGQGIGGLSASIDMTGWATARLDLYWISRGSSTGSGKFQGRVGFTAVGSAIGAGSPGDITTAAGGPDHALKVTSLGVFAGGTGPVSMRVYRFDGGAGDTLANKIGVLGLALTRLT